MLYILSPHKVQYPHITEVAKESIAAVLCCLHKFICHLSKINCSLLDSIFFYHPASVEKLSPR